MKRNILTIAGLGVALSTATLMAQSTTEAPRQSADRIAQTAGRQGTDNAAHARDLLNRYISADTVIVARADLSKLDLERAEQWLGDLLQQSDATPQQQQEARQDLGSKLQQARTWVQSLRDADVNELYAVTTLYQGTPVPLLIAPVKGEADAQRVQQILQPQQQDNLPMQLRAAHLGDAVVLAPPPILQQFQAGQEQPQQQQQQQGDTLDHLLAALDANNEAAVNVAIKPNPQLVQMAQAMIPGAHVLAGPDFNAAQDIRWVSLGFDHPDESAVKVVAQATDAQRAQQVSQWIDQRLGQQQQQQPGEAQPAGALQGVSPEVEGDQVTLTLSNDQTGQFLKQAISQAARQDQQRRQQQQPMGTPAQPGQQEHQDAAERPVTPQPRPTPQSADEAIPQRSPAPRLD